MTMADILKEYAEKHGLSIEEVMYRVFKRYGYQKPREVAVFWVNVYNADQRRYIHPLVVSDILRKEGYANPD